MDQDGSKTKRKHQSYSWSFKRQVIMEFKEGKMTGTALAAKYGVRNQRIFEWVRAYSRDVERRKIKPLPPMTTEEQKVHDALKAQNEALKKELEFAQMKAKAMEIMIDLAKTELGIDIRKNSGAKQQDK